VAEDKRASSAGRELGRLGAKKGGRARARALSPAERSEIARRAVRARWAKSGKVFTAPVGVARVEEVPRSVFRGPLTIEGMDFEAHVLSDGRRVLGQEGVAGAFTGGADASDLVRVIRKLPDHERRSVDVPTVVFRAARGSDSDRGYEAASLVAIADLFLSARAAGPLKKQPARAAAASESIVRAAATVGITGLVDEATGYAKVRAKQSVQWALQASIAEDSAAWASRFPKDFWEELARLDGVTSQTRPPLGWARYVVLFVYDAVDPDVGRELRRSPDDPGFRPTVHRWLEDVGRQRIDSRMASVVSAMRACPDMDAFGAAFAKVLQKGPSHVRLLEGEE
jgi:P63C domain